MTPPRWRPAAWCAALVAGMLWCGSALALDGEFTSDSAGQFYDVRSPTGETVLARRRFTTTLGLGVGDLLNTAPGDPKAPQLGLRLRLRYDADYGASPATSDPGQLGSLVPGYSPGLVDLMYAYVEGRRFLGGVLGFKAGRQYVTDVLGWWSFDGGEVSVTTPYYLRAEVYGGFEQRGGFPFSTSRFESDGIWRGNRTDYSSSTYAAFQPAGVAPAIGVALESMGVTWIHGRLTYRRVYDTDESNTTEFASGVFQTPPPYSAGRISSERLGYAVDATWSALGGAKAGVVYDLYRSEITSAYASLDAYLGKRVTLSADYDYYLPSFDGDSIWNFFGAEPRSNLDLRANANLDDRLSLAGTARMRIFTVQTEAFDANAGSSYSPATTSCPAGLGLVCGTVYPSSPHPFDEGGDLSARWRTPSTRFALRGSADFGQEGNREGADLSGEHVFEARYVVGARAGVWHWKDDLRAARETTSLQYVANLGYRFMPRCQGSVEWEHDMSGLAGQRFRLMFLLSLGFGK